MDASFLRSLQPQVKLLTVVNPKTAKNLSADGPKFLTGVLHLAPAYVAGGTNVCPAHTVVCAANCYFWSGRGAFKSVQNARIKRTHFYLNERLKFLVELHSDIWLLQSIAKFFGWRLAIRLNGTSDIRWERHNVPQSWPDILFYDYTKLPNRRDLPSNYHLTFSYSGHNVAACKQALANGMLVAVPFLKAPPVTWLGYPVIDGESNDLRPLQDGPAVVALRAKGKLRRSPLSIFLGDNLHE